MFCRFAFGCNHWPHHPHHRHHHRGCQGCDGKHAAGFSEVLFLQIDHSALSVATCALTPPTSTRTHTHTCPLTAHLGSVHPAGLAACVSSRCGYGPGSEWEGPWQQWWQAAPRQESPLGRLIMKVVRDRAEKIVLFNYLSNSFCSLMISGQYNLKDIVFFLIIII